MSDELLSFATEVAESAGEVLLHHFFRGTEVRQKGARDVVTAADMEAEARIVEAIHARFPEHKIFSEETRQDSYSETDTVWFIDPLDGTLNFSLGIPIFATSLACMRGGQMEVGVVYAPRLNELFSAARGQGATLNGQSLQIATTPDLNRHTLLFGGAREPLESARQIMHQVTSALEDIAAVRVYGAMAPEICFTASKPNVAAYFANFQPWDIAAAGLIAAEAGNKVTDLAGNPWNVRSASCLSAHPELHEILLSHLRKAVA